MSTLVQCDEILRSILEDPKDDLVRLVYADWLEEQGQTDRSQVIRLQVEAHQKEDQCPNKHLIKPFAGMRSVCGINTSDISWGIIKDISNIDCERCICLRKAATILNDTVEVSPNGRVWSGDVISKLGGVRYGYLRGFVGEFECVSLRDWLGTNKKGANGYGKEVVASQPIEHLQIVGKFPNTTRISASSGLVYQWILDDHWVIDQQTYFANPEVYYAVPGWIFDLLSGELTDTHRKSYITQLEANKALNDALINWARNLADLPPIKD